MKDANIAPAFACMYPGLCDKARELGYCLAIHGSVVTDLDLVAIPWTREAVGALELVKALKAHICACGYRELLERDCSSFANASQIDDMVRAERERTGNKPRGPMESELKPHGRLAWNLYLYHGAKVDLSVMPRVPQECDHV